MKTVLILSDRHRYLRLELVLRNQPGGFGAKQCCELRLILKKRLSEPY